MKGLFFVFLVASLTVCSQGAPQEDTDELDEEFYKKIFDDVDVDSIIDNDRVLDFYLKCFFDEGPCSELASSIKRHTGGFSTACGKCSDNQKRIFTHSLRKFIPKRPSDWEHMLKIYDPQGDYWPKIKEFLDQQPSDI